MNSLTAFIRAFFVVLATAFGLGNVANSVVLPADDIHYPTGPPNVSDQGPKVMSKTLNPSAYMSAYTVQNSYDFETGYDPPFMRMEL